MLYNAWKCFTSFNSYFYNSYFLFYYFCYYNYGSYIFDVKLDIWHRYRLIHILCSQQVHTHAWCFTSFSTEAFIALFKFAIFLFNHLTSFCKISFSLFEHNSLSVSFWISILCFFPGSSIFCWILSFSLGMS